MSRRNYAKMLKQATAAKRHKPMDVEEWLKRPMASATREEVYALQRQYYFEVERRRWMKNPFLVVPVVLFLVVTFPFRWGWKGIRALVKKSKGLS